MARIEDIPEPTRTAVVDLEMMRFASKPFVTGRALSKRRVALVSSAALLVRGDAPLLPGTVEFRTLPAALPSADLLLSHVSINFDRTGWQADVNTVYPIDRLRELAAQGVIGAVADTHYSVMGSTDPRTLTETADGIAGRMRAEGVDAALFCPV